MPRLNSIGKWCSGIAGAGAYYDGQTIAGGGSGGANFMDDTRVVYQDCSSGVCQTMIFNTENGTKTLAHAEGANEIRGGGGVWAKFLVATGVRTSLGLHLPEAGLYDVGPDGAVAVRDVYQANGPHSVHEKDGSSWVLSNSMDGIKDVHLLGDRRVIWTDVRAGVQTIGAPLPKLMAEGGYFIQMAEVNGAWYVGYANSQGLVIHPAQDATKPTILHPEHVEHMFGLTLRAVGNAVYYAYATNEGETPESVVVGSVEASVLGTGTPGVPGGGNPAGSSGTGGGMVLSSEATYPIADAGTAIIEAPIFSLPAWPVQKGRGRIIHPMLGAYDYQVKPDEWVNIDSDILVPPVWASTRTMTGATNVLWKGYIRDVVVQEHWKALGGLAMPIGMMRMLYMIWMNPLDPQIGYVEWYPNYISPLGFKVLPVALFAGGQGNFVFDDVVNYLDDRGPDGWVTQPVEFHLKIVDRVGESGVIAVA